MKKLLALLALLMLGMANLSAAEKYRVAWSHYTGWEPWGYAEAKGILKKWADKEGIQIELTLVNDYIESINLYTSGQFDACTMTNMDALTIPAVGGIDSTAVIVGDFSNGNDGIVMKKGKSVKDLKGRNIKLVELSVSHYLLSRALDKNGMSERDVKLTNTSDAEIASAFITDPNGAVVTWNPPLQQVRNAKGAVQIFDSSKIPGEIIDLMVVKTSAPDKLKRALVGAWYETMEIMSGRGKKTNEAIEFMAKQAGATTAEFKAQLRTTAMFYQAKKAKDFIAGDKPKQTMEQVRTFSFDKGLYGNNASSKDLVGIEFADGTVIGDKNNIKLRFTNKYTGLAADGKL
ncbi:MAG: putative urea ABC transporter substrate-binding protein [Gammaproteobacteria bacterium]|nr:putative urea ABC transporter substrate-binding protein [Gammaproteobacteria bacterium]MDH5651975.1 putative urea ABC transporter substrate-binding protein [Gammaproteobacteria bacterium]